MASWSELVVSLEEKQEEFEQRKRFITSGDSMQLDRKTRAKIAHARKTINHLEQDIMRLKKDVAAAPIRSGSEISADIANANKEIFELSGQDPNHFYVDGRSFDPDDPKKFRVWKLFHLVRVLHRERGRK